MRKAALFTSLAVCFWFWAAAICQNHYTSALLWLIWPGIVMAGNIVRGCRA